MNGLINFETDPTVYRHWSLSIEPPIAFLTLDVDEEASLQSGYTLKMNSYDLGVDIELHDAVQRLRFEHPEVGAVVIKSAKERIFCAGANIQMLALSTHAHKVNFCKFTNETRNAIEDASANSGQRYVAALDGTASGGGYELALACDHIMLVDDGNSAVSLPEIPLLGVLPGTGGLTRLVDKRKVRRDLADVFSTTAEGVRGRRALEWGLVDELVPRSRFDDVVPERAREAAAASTRPRDARGIELTPLARQVDAGRIRYPNVTADLDRDAGTVSITLLGPNSTDPHDISAIEALGAAWWPLALARELDDLLLHLRLNEPEAGTIVLRTKGQLEAVQAVDESLIKHADHWLVREVTLFLKRTLWRLELSSRSVFALIEPGSCFAGTTLELALAADRTYMLDGDLADGIPAARIALTTMNFGALPMPNGMNRLQSRYLGDPPYVEALVGRVGERLDASEALAAGLVTSAPDSIDWEEEIRLAIEERASFSPDALAGMEANLRFGGPETVDTKIFGRLSAWQNWIFLRPNASGEQGGLRSYGTGSRPRFDKKRV